MTPPQSIGQILVVVLPEQTVHGRPGRTADARTRRTDGRPGGRGGRTAAVGGKPGVPRLAEDGFRDRPRVEVGKVDDVDVWDRLLQLRGWLEIGRGSLTLD